MKEGFSFEKCRSCTSYTDVFCVSCETETEKWFCEECLKLCVQCEQHVCVKCYKDDMCCLIRPFGERTKRHFENFYQDKQKTLDRGGLFVLEHQIFYSKHFNAKWDKLRRETLQRSLLDFVQTAIFQSQKFPRIPFLLQIFPSLKIFLEDRVLRKKLLKFIHSLDANGLALLLLLSEDRKELIDLCHDVVEVGGQALDRLLLRYSLGKNGRPLFECLRNRGLLKWDCVESSRIYFLGHIEGIQWIEQNGIDVLSNRQHFANFARNASVEVLEYLIVERGMTIEYLLENRTIDRRGLTLIERLKGREEIQRIHIDKMELDFQTVAYLVSIGYNNYWKEVEDVEEDVLYAMICLGLLKYNELTDNQKIMVKKVYAPTHELKACKQMFPFMKEVRKRKIMTFLCCVRRLLPREIAWMILDFAYSPLNERGFVF